MITDAEAYSLGSTAGTEQKSPGLAARDLPDQSGEEDRAAPRRVAGLDGLRGLAAVYVLMFHCWLLTFAGFPANRGPAWTGVFMYGRLAVVLFLALSGFSLALSPAAKGWRLGSVAAFARRRAWRILPPYWAALLFSIWVGYNVVAASHHGPPTARATVIYASMLQDVFWAPTPNGAFWSIAVEAELYVVFPLLILLRRRIGAFGVLAFAFVPLVVHGLLAPDANPVEGSNHLVVSLAPVFVAGVVAAGVVTASERIRRIPWHWPAVATAAPVAAVIVVRGSVWTVHHYFWIDLAVIPAMVFLIMSVATGTAVSLRRLLDTRPMRSLGSFSYSLYLVHLPIVMIISRKLVRPYAGRGVDAFLLTLGLGLVLSITFAWGFAKLFELPFQRYRSWREVGMATTSLLSATRRRNQVPS
ncbi:acyltransferase family protein [Actinoplanes sp. NPDC051343]|uniref:acyltransferase family protein n=1 Tax=Actinoplanes sp. NPDC051343 TaxID=3363906 RepID=UPI0037BD215E